MAGELLLFFEFLGRKIGSKPRSTAVGELGDRALKHVPVLEATASGAVRVDYLPHHPWMAEGKVE
jgi:hypothetical protein